MKLTLILFLFTFTLTGQNIKGTILDKETNKPLAFVNVYFKKEKTGTISNEKGKFNLKLQSKIKQTDTIRFSLIGYHPKEYTLLKLNEENFIVSLSIKTENLSEITVTSKHKLNAQIYFKKLTSLEKGIYSFGSTIIDDKIYLIGGDESFLEDTTKKIIDEVNSYPNPTLQDMINESKSNFSWEKYSGKLQTYNIVNNTWQSSNLKFRKRAYHKIIYCNDKLFVLGGKTLSPNRKFEYLDDKIEELNVNTQQIIVDNTNPHQAINFTAFAYQDNIIVMGGSVKLKNNGEKIYTDKSHIYNITSGYWYELLKMTKPKEVNGLIIDDKVYLIGGFNKFPLKEIESYDLITKTWKNEGDLFYGIENLALTYHKNIIYIFNDSKILTYNIETKTLHEFRIELNLKNSEILYYQNHLYILGGFKEDDYTKSPSSGLFSIHLNEFAKTKIINSKENY